MIVQAKDELTDQLVKIANQRVEEMKESLADKLTTWSTNLAATLVTKVSVFQAKQTEQAEALIESVVPDYKKRLRVFIVQVINSFQTFMMKIFDIKRATEAVKEAYFAFREKTKGIVFSIFESYSWPLMDCFSETDDVFRKLRIYGTELTGVLPTSCRYRPASDVFTLYILEFPQGESGCEYRFAVPTSPNEGKSSGEWVLLQNGYVKPLCVQTEFYI